MNDKLITKNEGRNLKSDQLRLKIAIILFQGKMRAPCGMQFYMEFLYFGKSQVKKMFAL